ncbi:MAG: response regulator transcription factor [bacterium]|nr:response regulator transcription factor [bacterium]
MASILIVEDSQETVALIKRALRGNDLHLASTLGAARDLLAANFPLDLIVLDLGLPDGDGLSLASGLSSGGATEIPIIFLSARHDVRDKLAAFSLGAEDYIEKPFDVLELQARVGARLRKLEQLRDAPKELDFGRIRLEPESMRAFQSHEGQCEEIGLSSTEYRILRALLETPGWVLTREQLMARVWGGRVVGPRTIDSHVSNLRTKFDASLVQIESVRGVGYRLGFPQ